MTKKNKMVGAMHDLAKRADQKAIALDKSVNPYFRREAGQNLKMESAFKPKDIGAWRRQLMELGGDAVTSVEAAKNLGMIWQTIANCMAVSDNKTKLASAKLGVEFMRVWNDMLKQCQILSATNQGGAPGATGGVTVERALFLINQTTKPGELSSADFAYLDDPAYDPKAAEAREETPDGAE